MTESRLSQFREQRVVMSISWRNPYSEPPPGSPRTVWRLSASPDRARLLDRVAHHAFARLGLKPGCGYTLCWTPPKRSGPVRRWSPDAKARNRKRRLKERLERKVPLFSEMFYADEVARRPEYFEGKDCR